MSFKNHGPGGCCCVGTCPFWQDQFDLNGWYVDDDGRQVWDTHLGSSTSFYEQNGAMVATRSPTGLGAGNQRDQGPRLRYGFLEPEGALLWDLDKGYKAQYTINVDYGHLVLGHMNAGLLFDSLTNKAYPVSASNLYLSFSEISGEGFDFDPSYPFDVTLTRCGAISTVYNDPTFGVCQINAGPDRIGNTIDYRFQTDPNQGQWTGRPRTIKFDMWGNVKGDQLSSRTPFSNGNRSYYPAVVPSTPEITRVNRTDCQLRLHDLTMEGIGNLYRYSIYPNNPKNPLVSLGAATVPSYEEIKDCEIVPEWNIDDWINPYKVGNIEGYPIFGGEAKNQVRVTVSGSPSRPIDGEDTTGRLTNTSEFAQARGYGAYIWKDTPVLVPSGMVINTGRHIRRLVNFNRPNTILCRDDFIMDNVQEQIRINYWFEIGAAGNREFPFQLTSPFAADVSVINNAAVATPTIDPADAWTALGGREWLIEKL